MRVSIVMSTYNDADCLSTSIDSVLCQDFDDFEFIIVNDGSSDPRTAEILADYASRDARIRVLIKSNEGLTKALIDGCAAAKGTYIARTDVGDRYLPGRLARQVAFLDSCPEVAVVSCGTRYVIPEGDLLYEVVRTDSPAEATNRLRADHVGDIRGVTHHGSTMFRRSDYERVGGYRWQFYFAQDMDLWMRLTDHGLLAFIPEILYEATFAASGISGKYAREQMQLTALTVQMRQRRESGEAQDDLLDEVAAVRPAHGHENRLSRWRRLARGHYFIGCMLARNSNPRCRCYFLAALRLNPLHWRALLRGAQSVVVGRGVALDSPSESP